MQNGPKQSISNNPDFQMVDFKNPIQQNSKLPLTHTHLLYQHSSVGCVETAQTSPFNRHLSPFNTAMSMIEFNIHHIFQMQKWELRSQIVCCNKMPQIEWPNNRHLFLTVLKAAKSQDQGAGQFGSWRELSSGLHSGPFPLSSPGGDRELCQLFLQGYQTYWTRAYLTFSFQGFTL